MHVGSGNENLKTVAMFFPRTLEETTQHTRQNKLEPNNIINEGKNFVHSIRNFKYLGTHISNTLKEDCEIQTRIAKAWSKLGTMKHFVKCKDIDLGPKLYYTLEAQ